MASTSGKKPTDFNPLSASDLPEETHKAVTAAFEEMSTWRTETLTNSERCDARRMPH
jgi:hypothetical protein